MNRRASEVSRGKQGESQLRAKSRVRRVKVERVPKQGARILVAAEPNTRTGQELRGLGMVGEVGEHRRCRFFGAAGFVLFDR